MSDFPPPRPSTTEFGPDPAINTDPPVDTAVKEPPKVNQKIPPKPAPKSTGLGMNRKLRSPVRKLTRPDSELVKTDEISDFERIVQLYRWMAKAAHSLNLGRLSIALDASAVGGTEAWFDLAETNDTVRRHILGFIEGGEWGKLLIAHTPILMAVVPERVLERFFERVMAMFGQSMAQLDDTEDNG